MFERCLRVKVQPVGQVQQLLAKSLSVLKRTLVGGAVLGLIQPAFAVGIETAPGQGIFPTSGQGVYAALLDLDGVAPGAQRDSGPFAALSGFAKSVADGASQARNANGSVFAELADFARGVGASQAPQVRIRVADADSLFEALSNAAKGGTPAPAAPAPAPGPAVKAKRVGPPVDAHFMGDKTCLTCHANYAEEFQKTLMGRISKTQPGKFACENCHGPGSEHVKAGGGRGVGGIISFRPEDKSRTAEENNAICLACHERGDRTYWQGSIHQTRDLACTNCHTIMKVVSRKFQLKTVNEMDTCFQCHKDRRAQVWRSSHMPLREGKMVCSDCHNPHGSATESLLKADSINDLCYKCHAEKRGPFLFEHAPVRENCLNCHDPHGTVNEYSLKLSRPRLCFECHGFGHGATTGPNSPYTMGRQCQNCHTEIHGSNSPAGGAFQR